MKLLLKNGHVLDPASRKGGRFDVLISEERIEKVQTRITDRVDKLIDLTGCYVMPGLIDMHSHLREPGNPEKETFVTAGRAAVKGGYTSICAMPNTNPTCDSVFMVSDVVRQAANESLVNVLPVGAVTMGQKGRQLVDMEAMVGEGAVAFSSEGNTVTDSRVMRRVMERAVKTGVPILCYCQDKNLTAKGSMNAGAKARSLGLAGISRSAEEVYLARDILLAGETGCQIHLEQLSTKNGVMMLWLAKEQGMSISAEVCPHHFVLTEDAVQKDPPVGKVYPPLRTEEDRSALVEALRSGLIEVIASGHAPHEEGEWTFDSAPFGFSCLETTLPVTYTELVRSGILTPMQMVEKMSYNPAKILHINRGTLEPGSIADITVFDPRPEYEIDKEAFASLGRNTPFQGRKVFGRVRATIVNGRVVFMK